MKAYKMRVSKNPTYSSNDSKETVYKPDIFERVGKAFKKGYKSKKEKLWEYEHMKSDYGKMKDEVGRYKALEKKEQAKMKQKEKFGPSLKEILDKAEYTKLEGVEVPENFVNKPIKKVMVEIKNLGDSLKRTEQYENSMMNTYKEEAKKAEKEKKYVDGLLLKYAEENRPLDRMEKFELAIKSKTADEKQKMYLGRWANVAKKNNATRSDRLKTDWAYNILKERCIGHGTKDLTPEEGTKLAEYILGAFAESSQYERDNTIFEESIGNEIEEIERMTDDIIGKVKKESRRLTGESEEEAGEEA